MALPRLPLSDPRSTQRPSSKTPALSRPGDTAASVSQTFRSGPSLVSRFSIRTTSESSGNRNSCTVPLVGCSWLTRSPCATTSVTAAPVAVTCGPGTCPAVAAGGASSTMVLVNNFQGWNQ